METKKILLLGALVLGLSSCSMMTNKSLQYTEVGTVIDYSKYDMFITEATSVNFEYNPIGSVQGFVSSGYQGGGNNYITATPDDAVRILVSNAKMIGAYGLISVKISRNVEYNSEYKNAVVSYTASGMAIKWQ